MTESNMNVASYRSCVKNFYDNFAAKLLTDFVKGNPRIKAAIEHTLDWIPLEAGRILDIGCGIGWSTREIARHRPAAEIIGLDLSPRLIEVAQGLADEENVRFQATDFCSFQDDSLGVFDAIVMLDVYEHFPTSKRADVHCALARLLTKEGVLILACPTPAHQAFLRNEHPEGLQPIDEDVTKDDIAHLAEDIDARIRYCRDVTIWRPNDYRHAALARADWQENTVKDEASTRIKLETDSARTARLHSRLKVQVLSGGIVARVADGPSLCVACSTLNAVSETFIRNHITRLPFSVHVLHTKRLCYDGTGRYVGPSRPTRLLQRISRRLGGSGLPGVDVHALARFLRRNRVAAVLAEYGLNGAKMTKPCADAGVPLVVHFHGYDAYVNDVIESNRQQYGEMFEQAAAIIAVSRDMEQQLIELGAPAEKIVYNACGVDMELFANACPEQAPSHFVAVGRFVEKKSPHLTLLAFAKLLDAHPDARLTMIGDGPLFGLCRQLADALGISVKVEFTGFRDHEFVSRAMQKSRAFVQHSVRPLNGDSEGTPVAVIEAQATGLPVVATAHAGIKDVVLDGKTGFLVKELDIDAMADAMVRVAEDPELAARLGRSGRQRVRDHFSQEISLGRLARVIEKASSGVLQATPASETAVGQSLPGRCQPGSTDC